jgi:hypothetical protein
MTALPIHSLTLTLPSPIKGEGNKEEGLTPLLNASII